MVWLVPFSTQKRQPRNELEQGESHDVPSQRASCYRHCLLPAQTTKWWQRWAELVPAGVSWLPVSREPARHGAGQCSPWLGSILIISSVKLFSFASFLNSAVILGLTCRVLPKGKDTS